LEKRTPERPVPLAVAIITEIFFHFTKIFFNGSLMDEFNVPSMTTRAGNVLLLFLIQSPLNERRNQRVGLRMNHGDPAFIEPANLWFATWMNGRIVQNLFYAVQPFS
jgi:hypothetical protein